MTLLSIYVLIILIIYLSAFFIQNLKTYFSVKLSIRGRSTKLTVSLLLSTIIYLLTFGLILFPGLGERLVFWVSMDSLVFQISGAFLMTIALFVGLTALYEMKNSWRVGIKYDQKTELVTTGIYSFSRNPYFLSYNLLFTGIFLIFPSAILLILILALMFTFHKMILEEEQYLEGVQGDDYLKYKKKTGRYLFLL